MSDWASTSANWVIHVLISDVACEIKLFANATSLKYKYIFSFNSLSSKTGTVMKQ